MTSEKELKEDKMVERYFGELELKGQVYIGSEEYNIKSMLRKTLQQRNAEVKQTIEEFDFGKYLEPDEDLEERYYGIDLTNMLKELLKELGLGEE